MKSKIPLLERINIKLKKELSTPGLTRVKRTYIAEKLKLLGHYLINRQK